MNDYRYNPFLNALEPIAITGEMHTIPSNSPYTIRLCEVPVKTDPTSITLTIAGVAGVEVAAEPAAGEFWADYSTKADGDNNWNTGTVEFNSADAGKTVVVSYQGMGSLVSAADHGFQLFTASGTFTVPKGIATVYVTGCGGGGGGGDSYNQYCGGGGGGGACAYKTPLSVAAGQSYAITIGAGGAGSAADKLAGSAGGITSFGALLSLAGGGRGGGFGTANGSKAGGAAGNALASAGGSACSITLSESPMDIFGGAGGGSMFGTGGAVYCNSASPGTGYGGSGYGAGGAGGSDDSGGGSGSQGFILVEW